MWSTIRIAAARQLRVGGALSVSRLASRVATKQSSFAIPSRYRFQLGRRGFADVAGQPAKATTTKKAAAKKPAKGAKKVASKKAASKKTAAKKAAPKKRVRKVLSEEDAKKQKVRELKRVALLKEPVRLPDKSWLVYVSQHTKGTHTEGEALGDRAKQLSESYKQLPSSEVEHLQATANQNKLANDAAYKSWVESHSPEEIADANRARKRLKRDFKATSKGLIKDERQPKRSLSSYLLFVKSRWQSGDLTGQHPVEASKSMSGEWKALSDAERQPFIDGALLDMNRYVREKKSVLNQDVQRRNSA
ncbi:hypothetical protein QBC33DRAFT_531956 [Phialemonium atrogriseum]|uniref:HMG box domain-containing protein n=1 Tax=Phialemonium atrogriseum TaxID=1093897 RepID=A0AAJ0C431_9PEZI|nr:uncharacterized protein QBC33DRAFT_531956 [Phialemonium atrogriseum]KAK1769779.1 hypothetical protein QBC33DRAFT_531956 [Phialemonium atrogriseum]